MDQPAVHMMPSSRALRSISLGVCAWAVLAPVQGQAQCLLCTSAAPSADAIATPETADLPLSVTIIADLDFSRLVAGTGGGTVTLDPASGASIARGNVAAIGGYGFGGRVSVSGTAGRTIRITMPDSILLTSSTGRSIYVRNLATNLPPLARIGPDGRLEFTFGGRLELSGEADGNYNGRVAVTVSYE